MLLVRRAQVFSCSIIPHHHAIKQVRVTRLCSKGEVAFWGALSYTGCVCESPQRRRQFRMLRIFNVICRHKRRVLYADFFAAARVFDATIPWLSYHFRLPTYSPTQLRPLSTTCATRTPQGPHAHSDDQTHPQDPWPTSAGAAQGPQRGEDVTTSRHLGDSSLSNERFLL